MSSLLERDRRVLWHPATHFGDLERLPPIPVSRAKGPWLHTERGDEILDGIGSWWTSVHGHGHPHIVEAIAAQANSLDHVMFAGFTHAAAVDLAERLVEAAPMPAGRVFFADCGSAAVEVALKMSWQARQLEGQSKRTRFATLRGGYHGETLGALGVCGDPPWRQDFAPLLYEGLVELPVPRMDAHRHEDLAAQAGADAPETAAALELLERHGDELCALIVEPIVQCACRMSMPGAGYVQRVAQAARHRGIHVIADEIAVGFGRTGRMFAGDWFDAEYDLLCLSKGLSGGALPLAAVVAREGFDEVFHGGPERSFLHSHTFTGNPIACAAARASMEVFERERTLALENLQPRLDAMRDGLRDVAQRCPSVVTWRQAGLVGALEVRAEGSRRGPPAGNRLGLALREAALKRGVLLRPLHDTIYWMPALNFELDLFERLRDATAAAIEEVLG